MIPRPVPSFTQYEKKEEERKKQDELKKNKKEKSKSTLLLEKYDDTHTNYKSFKLGAQLSKVSNFHSPDLYNTTLKRNGK